MTARKDAFDVVAVPVEVPGLAALIVALEDAVTAVTAIVATRGDDLQFEAILGARMRSQAALRAARALRVGPAYCLPP